jgi:hypothetical protein
MPDVFRRGVRAIEEIIVNCGLLACRLFAEHRDRATVERRRARSGRVQKRRPDGEQPPQKKFFNSTPKWRVGVRIRIQNARIEQNRFGAPVRRRPLRRHLAPGFPPLARRPTRAEHVSFVAGRTVGAALGARDRWLMRRSTRRRRSGVRYRSDGATRQSAAADNRSARHRARPASTPAHTPQSIVSLVRRRDAGAAETCG